MDTGKVSLSDNLQFEHLFSLQAELNPSIDAGNGPLGRRILNSVAAGSFSGDRLRGSVLPGTGDWMLTRADGISIVDARIVLKTDDRAVIHMSYGGRIVIPKERLSEIRDPERRHLVEPSAYYFRTTPTFETGAEKYMWLNNIVCVGKGRLLKGRGVGYEVYQLA